MANAKASGRAKYVGLTVGGSAARGDSNQPADDYLAESDAETDNLYDNNRGYQGCDEPSGEEAAFMDEDNMGSWAFDALKAMQALSVITGKPGNLSDPKAMASRAEVAAMIHRFWEAIK